LSAVLCVIPLSPSVCDRPTIDKLDDFPAVEARRGDLVDIAGGGMLARAQGGGASFARGVTQLEPYGGAVGEHGRLELAGRFSFDRRGHYVSVLRADDFATRAGAAVQLGVERQYGDGRLHMAARRYDGSWLGFDIATDIEPVPGREYALVLRATVGSSPGAASTELWVDDMLAATSTAPNILPGRAFTKARAGAVAVAASPATVLMRRVRIASAGGLTGLALDPWGRAPPPGPGGPEV
jgi:hypothetical protein